MDKVIAVTSHMGRLLIFMESGRIYEMVLSQFDFNIKFQLLAEVPQR